jgi:hypothetical protein
MSMDASIVNAKIGVPKLLASEVSSAVEAAVRTPVKAVTLPS